MLNRPHDGDSQDGWTRVVSPYSRSKKCHYWRAGDNRSLCGRAFRTGNEKPLAAYCATANRCGNCEAVRLSGRVPSGFNCSGRG